ncbi:MAG: hypothetical protein HGB17_12665, partial [Syntrophobacteraceae bacterium]|nr:hypothetical protein [Syntrophobacteraceae bacterium]
ILLGLAATYILHGSLIMTVVLNAPQRMSGEALFFVAVGTVCGLVSGAILGAIGGAVLATSLK